jgi:hypothetical protein
MELGAGRAAPEAVAELCPQAYREFGAAPQESVRRAAHRAFGDGSLHTTVVGKPEGI